MSKRIHQIIAGYPDGCGACGDCFLLANLVQKLAIKFFTTVSHNKAVNHLFFTLVYVFIIGVTIEDTR